LWFTTTNKLLEREASMGNFEKGVEKKFKGDKVAGKKYEKTVKQGASKLSQAAKQRKKTSK
jgi:hypothetical protein